MVNRPILLVRLDQRLRSMCVVPISTFDSQLSPQTRGICSILLFSSIFSSMRDVPTLRYGRHDV